MRNLGQVSRRCDFEDGMRMSYLSGQDVRPSPNGKNIVDESQGGRI